MTNSFSSKIKNEIVHLIFEDHCKRAMLSSIFKNIGTFQKRESKNYLKLNTNNPSIIKFIYSLIKDIYGTKSKFGTSTLNNLNKNKRYEIVIDLDAYSVFTDLYLNDLSAIQKNILNKECCRRAFISGAFLSAGSISSPSSIYYHFEIQSFSEDYINLLDELFNDFDFHFKIIKRRNTYVLYNKKSEIISDILKLMGCSVSVLEFENARMERDLTNSVNRLNNLDISNERKSLEASDKHIINIEYVLKNKPHLLTKKEIIVLKEKLNHPEESMVDLIKIVKAKRNITITKSTLNHYFRKIKEIYINNN